MIPRWKVRSRHKMRKMPLTSRCRKHPKTIDTTCRHDMTKSIGELHGAKELLALHFGMSTGRQVDRSTGRQVDRSLTGPWQVTCAVERSAVCQVHKVLEQRFNLDGSPMAAMARSRDQSETCCLEASRDIFAILCQSIAIFTDFSTYSSTGLPCYWLEWYAESHFQPANCKCCLCLLILGLKGVTMFVSHSGWFWYALVDMNCQHVLDHAETEVDLTSEMRPERCEDFAAFFRYQSSQFSQSEINLQSWTSEINLHNFHNLSHAQL